MNRSGFASCSNPTTTSRSRFLRTMGQMGQLVHHGEEAGDGAALSQPCLPHLVPPLLDKPFLEAHLDERSLSQAAEKDGRPSRSLSRIAVGPRDPSSCRSEGSCPKQPDFMSRSPRGVQTTQGSDVGIGESAAGICGLAGIFTSGASLDEGSLLPPEGQPMGGRPGIPAVVSHASGV